MRVILWLALLSLASGPYAHTATPAPVLEIDLIVSLPAEYGLARVRAELPDEGGAPFQAFEVWIGTEPIIVDPKVFRGVVQPDLSTIEVSYEIGPRAPLTVSIQFEFGQRSGENRRRHLLLIEDGTVVASFVESPTEAGYEATCEGYNDFWNGFCGRQNPWPPGKD